MMTCGWDLEDELFGGMTKEMRLRGGRAGVDGWNVERGDGGTRSYILGVRSGGA